jgi:hypothetical protein
MPVDQVGAPLKGCGSGEIINQIGFDLKKWPGCNDQVGVPRFDPVKAGF